MLQLSLPLSSLLSVFLPHRLSPAIVLSLISALPSKRQGADKPFLYGTSKKSTGKSIYQTKLYSACPQIVLCRLLWLVDSLQYNPITRIHFLCVPLLGTDAFLSYLKCQVILSNLFWNEEMQWTPHRPLRTPIWLFHTEEICVPPALCVHCKLIPYADWTRGLLVSSKYEVAAVEEVPVCVCVRACLYACIREGGAEEGHISIALVCKFIGNLCFNHGRQGPPWKVPLTTRIAACKEENKLNDSFFILTQRQR